MAISSSANLRSSIDTSVTDNTDNKRTFVKSFNNGFLYSYTQGVGTGNINNGVFISGSIASGESVFFDMRSLVEEGFGTTSTYTFDRLGAFNIYNMSHASGADLWVRATGVGATASNPGGGSNAWTNLFGDQSTSSGDLRIKPYSTFQVNDPYNTLAVTDTNRYVSLFADGSQVTGICSGLDGSGGAAGCWEYILTAVGVTGA
jgi:hypothetical protein